MSTPIRRPGVDPATARPSLDVGPGARAVEAGAITALEVRGSLSALAHTWTSDVAATGRPKGLFVPEACLPAFALLVGAGIGEEEALNLALAGIDEVQAGLQVRRLLESPTSLEGFGQKALAIALLVRATEGGLSGQEVRALVRGFQGLRILRPDGVIADPLTGRAIERAGALREDGEVWRAGGLVVGALYRDLGGVLYELDDHLAEDRTRGPVFELSLDRMAVGRALDGAERAFVGAAVGLAELIRDPTTAIDGLVQALRGAGAVLANAPELADAFLALPPGDRVETVSELVVSVLLARSAGKASAALIGEGGAASSLRFAWSGSVGSLAITVDLQGAAVGVAGLALAPVLVIGPAALLSRAEGPAGPANRLTPPSEITQASVKRLAKTLGKEVVEAKAKEIQRIEAEGAKLVQRMEAMLAKGDLNQELRANLKHAVKAIKKHLTPEDQAGALRDAVGIPVRKPGSGEPYDHAKEVRDGVRSLQNVKRSLGAAARNQARGSAQAREFSALADEVLDLARRIQAVIQVEP